MSRHKGAVYQPRGEPFAQCCASYQAVTRSCITDPMICRASLKVVNLTSTSAISLVTTCSGSADVTMLLRSSMNDHEGIKLRCQNNHTELQMLRLL